MTSYTDDITSRSFAASFRGFDKAEVRKFLADVAVQQQVLAFRAQEAEARLDDLRGRLESVEDLLRAADEKYEAAQAQLDELESRPPEPEIQLVAVPEQDAVKAFGEKVTEVLQIAVAAGNSIRAEAESWASQRRREADEQAATTLASARQEVADIVAQEETNVDQLKSAERALRSWLRAAHTAIGQVLEQPVVEPRELSAVMRAIREIGPSQGTGEWIQPGPQDELEHEIEEEPQPELEDEAPKEPVEPNETCEPMDELRPYVFDPAMQPSNFG